jgi:hypothetical protein
MKAPPWGRRLAVLIAIVGAAGTRVVEAGESEPAAPTADTTRSAASARHTQFFPLPLYATSPNEGSTYGALPVFMRVAADGRTTSITAPSLSWNRAAGFSGTFRFYSFAHRTRVWWVILAASTNVNRSLRFEYRDVPGHPRRLTVEIQALARRNLFYRFFGLGPDTTEADQSSYTRVLALLSVRGGVNVVPHVNVGLRGGVRWDRPQRGAIFGLPSTQDRYPDVPGLEGAALATAGLSLRFDTRAQGDFDVRGLASEAHLARDVGFAGGVSMWRLTWHTRVLVPETSFLSGAARLYWTDALGGGADVPFFHQSALGGDTLFRGFSEGRFIDRGAWEAEIEQRFRLFQTDWFHVRADWRIDPFVAVGQVYSSVDNLVSHVRVVGGVGLRAFVRPNVLGRVDLAYSSDGFNAYVLLGYPY